MKRIGIKKWFVFVAVLLIGVYFTACSDDKEDEGGSIDPLEEIFDIDQSELLYGVTEETLPVKITSNVSWTIVATADWCEPSVLAGNSDAEVQVHVTENNSVNDRRCQLILKGGKKKYVLDVVQLGDTPQTVVYDSGVEIKDGEDANVALLDFEGKVYLVNIVSNVDCNISFQQSGWLKYRSSTDYAAPMNIHYAYEIYPEDNSETSTRDAFLMMTQKMGDYSRAVTIRQKGFSDFLRVFDDTIVLGSHYNVMELEARTTVHWEYELQGDHSWLDNWRERRNPASTYELGTRSRLLADVETNRDATSRECDVIFKYAVDGKSMQQKVKVIQLGYNGLRSDSLVLMDIVKMNSTPLAGLSVEWILGVPLTSWGNISIGKDENNEPRIITLQLANCGLCYELTASIANLTQLRSLNIMKNYVEGSLPAELGRLKYLAELDISENYSDVADESPSYRLAGVEEIPEEVFEGCTSLRTLNLGMNRLRAIPNSIGNLVNLETLDIGGENELIRVPDNKVFSSLKQLKSLYIADWKAWKGDFFDFIFDLPELREVTIFRINFNDGQKLGDHFDRLPNLTSFSCGSTNLEGEIPASILNCSELKMFSLSENKFTGELLPELPNLKKLMTIVFNDNSFTGGIPESYAEFGMNLGEDSPRGVYTNLFLYGNRLTGEIPAAMLSCPMWKSGTLKWDPQTFICPQQAGYGFTNCK